MACVALLALACAPEPRITEVVFALPDALGCRPTDVDQVALRALGDFPAGVENVLVFDPASPPEAIDRFPGETQLLAIEARGSIGSSPWIGGGVARLGEGSETLMLPLLRYGRACPLSDVRARIPNGAAFTALPDGRAWIAGGEEDGAVRASVVTVRPGETLATASAARLFIDRAFATASVVGDLVVVTGGSAAVDGAGEDTFELVQISSDARIGGGFLLEPRREHAAIARAEGVVISGGRREAGGAPIGSVEVLRVEGEGGESVRAGALDVPRAGHVMLALDDGSVAIAGGVDAEGEPVTVVERLVDGAIERFGGFEEPRADAAYAALPGARIARIGGRDDEGWSGEVELLLEDGAVSLGEVIPPLEQPVAAARGGVLIVVGRDPVDRRARGVLLDPDAPPARPFESSRPATALFVLADGAFVEGDADGLSLLRIDAATPFDPPPASIAPAFMEDREALAIDAPGRWTVADGALVASVAGARFDVPSLRFADVAITLDAGPGIELLLVRGDRPPVVIALAQDGAALGDCEVTRSPDAPLRVVRAGDRLTLDGGEGARDCAVELPMRVGVAVRARQEGAGVRLLELERL